jgi:hypothetical protein
MFVNLRGRPYALWRVADERGAELDVLRQNCRDKSAVKSVFKSALGSVAHRTAVPIGPCPDSFERRKGTFASMLLNAPVSLSASSSSFLSALLLPQAQHASLIPRSDFVRPLL